MTRLLACAAAIAFGLAGSLAAQGPIPNVNDGHALLRECATALRAADNEPDTNPDELERGSDMGQCLGLVSGVWHTHMVMVAEFGGREAFCPLDHDHRRPDGPNRPRVSRRAPDRAHRVGHRARPARVR